MATTLTVSNAGTIENIGNMKLLFCSVIFGGTYTTGGDEVDPGKFGMERIRYISFQPGDCVMPTAIIPTFIRSTPSAAAKIGFTDVSTLGQLAGAHAMNNATFDCMVFGY